MIAARQSKHNPNQTRIYRFGGFNNRNAFHGWELGLIFGTLMNENRPAAPAIGKVVELIDRAFFRESLRN